MSKCDNLIGRKFNHLLVTERVENSKTGQSRWRCLCDCGKMTIVSGGNLKFGGVKSCGCIKHIPHNKTHSMSKSRIYSIWSAMKDRCYYQHAKSYNDYGKRGIKVCEEWKKSFETFYAWAKENGYEETLTIDRIDVNGDYCPENCRWVTKSEQSNNRRSCIVIEYNGKSQNLMQWCKELGLNYKRTNYRIVCLGMTFEEAISRPVQIEKRNKKARLIYG